VLSDGTRWAGRLDLLRTAGKRRKASSAADPFDGRATRRASPGSAAGWIEGASAFITSNDADSSRVSFYVRIPISARHTARIPQPGELIFFKGVANKHCMASGRVSRSYICPKRATCFIELVEFRLDEQRQPASLDPIDARPSAEDREKLIKAPKKEYRDKML
jgi:hypothetical protein